MPKQHCIRSRYADILRALAGDYSPDDEPVGYRIRAAATMAECKKYAVCYLVGREDSRPHYRYDRYRLILEYALKRCDCGESVIHLDLGCGPGLFTWVVRNFFLQHSHIEIRYYGYDYAPSMVKLARIVWDCLDTQEKLSLYHSVDEIVTVAQRLSVLAGFVIVTFGHVLFQTYDNPKAMDDFARAIAAFARSRTCIIAASDAHSGARSQYFKHACCKLISAMARYGLTVDMDFTSGRSQMFGETGAEA